MFKKFLKYIHAEDIKTRDELWALYREWIDGGKPTLNNPSTVSTQVSDFVDTMCDVAVDRKVSKIELHEIYMMYSGDYRGVSIFSRELRALLRGKIIDYRPSASTDGKRLRYWRGIGLKA